MIVIIFVVMIFILAWIKMRQPLKSQNVNYNISDKKQIKMTKEEKQLLLKDLCSRLPYGVKIQVYYEEIAGSGYFNEDVWTVDNDEPFHVNDRWLENIKPYLRSMSSMTEEEKRKYDELCGYCLEQDPVDYNISNLDRTQLIFVIEWLNEHYFDYRGLIEKGLALEAPKGMYKFD